MCLQVRGVRPWGRWSRSGHGGVQQKTIRGTDVKRREGARGGDRLNYTPRTERRVKNGGQCMHACFVALVVPDSLWPYGPRPAWLLCPRDSPGKDTGVGCHFLILLKNKEEGWPTLLKCLECHEEATEAKEEVSLCQVTSGKLGKEDQVRARDAGRRWGKGFL